MSQATTQSNEHIAPRPASDDVPTASTTHSADQAQIATPVPMPVYMSALYIAASFVLWSTRGLSMNFISANTQHIQGPLGATLTETTWLVAAYMAPFASLTILLIKIRTQYGLRRFAEISIITFLLSSLLHLFVFDLWSAILVRFIAGAASAPVSTLAFLYMLEAFSPAKKMSWGLSLALTCSVMVAPFARIISPILLDIGEWQQLNLLEIGLSLVSLAIVFVLPLTHTPRANVLHWMDFVAYAFIAIGFGLLSVILVQGKNYWWFEAPWIGICLAISVLSLAIAAVIELNRESPLMNLQWLFSAPILRFTLMLFIFRIVLAEQAVGAIGLFQSFGLQDTQSLLLYFIILVTSFAGGIFCGWWMNSDRISMLLAFSLIFIAIGAYMDSNATNLTRPENFYFSQALIAFGGALFLPPATLSGLTKALKHGPAYMTSFIVLFLFSQNIGGLMGSSLFTTFIAIREKYHSAHLVEHLVMTDPIVAQRVHELSSIYTKTLPDQSLANAEGLILLAQQTTREAIILSYNDAFLAISVIAIIALISLQSYRIYENYHTKRTQSALSPA